MIPLIHHFVNTKVIPLKHFIDTTIFLCYYSLMEVISMAIGEDKTRTNITFPKELKAKLEELAQKDGRSFNNLVIKILSDYVEDTQK